MCLTVSIHVVNSSVEDMLINLKNCIEIRELLLWRVLIGLSLVAKNTKEA